MNSTSVHTLNADEKLNKANRFLWFILNWANNNFFSNAKDPALLTRDFIADISEANWSQTDIKSSPSRKLSDLFWLQLPWWLIRSELGEINIFDTGCGSGNYGVKLQSYSKNIIANYTGVDLSQHDNWNVLEERYPNLSFHRLDSADIIDYIPEDINLFISQSAIEHFKNDLTYFKHIREFVRRTSKSVMQVHLFPSRACLKLNLEHGVRQYTPRTISLITRLFQDCSYSTLYRMGGTECNKLHWEMITQPLFFHKIGDLRETRTQEYDQRLRQAIAADNKKPGEPNFYALLIHSHWQDAVFRMEW
ncbi:MAG: class I SAM-dependent methyltransferase [Deltaproteobacteria bacterium]|nr:class I SAM-dependent methyltransferase [Deltaproteobacteria bacterium]